MMKSLKNNLYSELNLLKENKDALNRLKLLVQMNIHLMDLDFPERVEGTTEDGFTFLTDSGKFKFITWKEYEEIIK